MTSERVVVAIGGHALAHSPGAPPQEQAEAVESAVGPIADLIVDGYELALTHGNGPQVGNLLLKNQVARDVVPAVPLDWCVAQTQGTLGYLITTALERAMAGRGEQRAIATILTRVLVDRDDEAFSRPTKPIGRERVLVPSPRPVRILDEHTIVHLLDDGAVVVAAGGGGVPMVLDHGILHGVEAVIDKDRTASLLASKVGAQSLVIATDVDGVAVGHGTAAEQWLDRTTPAELRGMLASGMLDPGSIGPKVEACIEFVESGGRRAVIAPLAKLGDALHGRAGTVIEGAAA